MDNVEVVSGLYGSEFDRCKACGFCKRHNRYLTVKQLKQHECLKKQCWHLLKNDEHEWWKQRERTNQKRKARKAVLKNI